MKLVKDIMSRNPCCIHPDTTLREAAEEMREHSIGCLPIVDGDHVVGILTDRDIVIRAIAAGQNPTNVPARDIMSNKPMTIRADRTVAEAAEAMKQRAVRRLVAVDGDGKPVGLLSLGDLAAHREDRDTTLAANDVLGRVCAAC